MNNVIIGMLGSRLDQAGLGKRRWQRWRPSVSLLMHADLPVHECLLLYLPDNEELLAVTLQDMAEVSPGTRVTAIPVACDDPWDFEQVYSALHDVALAQVFDAEKNNYFINITTGTHVAQICLYLLTEARYLPGKLLQASPGPEGVTLPSGTHGVPGTYQIIDLDLSRYDQIASRFAKESHDALTHLKSGIQTRNAAFNTLIAQLEQVSIKSSAPLLLNGPTGAGKSQLARRIYELKQQRNLVVGPLVEVNCATLRGDNAMSALFGHIKGAFTGAQNSRPGLLREAHNGVLFLDEIGELGVDEQAMLLRALEEKSFIPLGADKPVSSDFQLIAGTHKDLFEQVRLGAFREDLLARINLWTYRLPSLKERLEDLEPNIEHELQVFMRKAGHKVSFNKAAREQYLAFALSPQALWRANFRDLNASITRMATLAHGGRITTDIVDAEIQRLAYAWQGFQTGYTDTEQHLTLQNYLPAEQLQSMDVFDQLQLQQVIAVCLRSRSLAEAGRELFNVSRDKKSSNNDSHRLKQYLQKFGLSFSQFEK